MESLRMIQRGGRLTVCIPCLSFPNVCEKLSIDVFDLAAPLPKRECTAHSGLNPWVHSAPSQLTTAELQRLSSAQRPTSPRAQHRTPHTAHRTKQRPRGMFLQFPGPGQQTMKSNLQFLGHCNLAPAAPLPPPYLVFPLLLNCFEDMTLSLPSLGTGPSLLTGPSQGE